MSDFVWSEVRFFELDRVLSGKSRSVSIMWIIASKKLWPVSVYWIGRIGFFFQRVSSAWSDETVMILFSFKQFFVNVFRWRRYRQKNGDTPRCIATLGSLALPKWWPWPPCTGIHLAPRNIWEAAPLVHVSPCERRQWYGSSHRGPHQLSARRYRSRSVGSTAAEAFDLSAASVPGPTRPEWLLVPEPSCPLVSVPAFRIFSVVAIWVHDARERRDSWDGRSRLNTVENVAHYEEVCRCLGPWESALAWAAIHEAARLLFTVTGDINILLSWGVRKGEQIFVTF